MGEKFSKLSLAQHSAAKSCQQQRKPAAKSAAAGVATIRELPSGYEAASPAAEAPRFVELEQDGTSSGEAFW